MYDKHRFVYAAASRGWNTNISLVYFSNSSVKSSCWTKDKFQPFIFKLDPSLLFCNFEIRNQKLHFWFMNSMLDEGMRATLPLGVWGFLMQMLQNQWNKYIKNFLFLERHPPVPAFVIWLSFIAK